MSTIHTAKAGPKTSELRKRLANLDRWDKIVRLDLYPVHDPGCPAARQLVARCQEQMLGGACELPDFLTKDAVEILQLESAIMEHKAFFKPVVGNPYLTPEDPKLPADHPNRMTETTRVGVLAYDEYPTDSLLRQIYEWDPMMHFIGQVLKLPQIHRYADPMGGLNLSVMQDGDYLRWHFDQTDFVSSISIQTSTEGGEFEYVPMIRTEKDENYGEVSQLLKGDRSKVATITNHPGTLLLFRGRWSIHRVTPIKGTRSRLMGLFGFDSKAGVKSSPHLYDIRYGRSKPMKTPPSFEDYEHAGKN
ncbi:MAG: hypothetical protein RIQ81_238 [Pseudomonadota bacterium]